MTTRRDRLTAVALLLGGVTSLQFGAALAATVFPLVGPVAVVSLRLLTSALALVLVGRGLRIPGRTVAELATPVAMGVVLAVMNTCVYEAIARLPLGVVITLEFLGPLAIALIHSRRRTDVVLALAALAGVALLTGGLGGADDLAGVVFVLVAAVGWALYITLNREMGRREADGGLAFASVVAAVLVIPLAIAQAGRGVLQPRVLLIGLAVGVLSSAVPYTLDRLALRRIEPGPFGVLMSVHPAVAALAGLLLLDQTLTPTQLAGMAVVIVVSALSVRATPSPAPEPAIAAVPAVPPAGPDAAPGHGSSSPQ
jgi:inner membrane transporter RhtA